MNRKVVLFLHGWGLSRDSWNTILPLLEKEYNVYAVDLPAFGDNIQEYKVFSLKDYVEFVEHFLTEKNIKKCIVVGHSFGGKVASLFTLEHHEQVEKLVLYSATLPLSVMPESIVRKIMKASVFTNPILLWSLIARGLKKKKFSVMDFKQITAIHRLVNSVNPFKDRLYQIKQPVLVMAGMFDYVSSLTYQKLLAKQFTNVQFEIFKRSTHLTHKEEKEKFVSILRNFIDR
jgi:pimeloyl-ACP methyl ester carboxylesterase